MTSINVNFGAGDVGGYDDILGLTGGFKLNGAFFNNSTFLEATSGYYLTQSSTYALSFWYKIEEDLSNASEEPRPIFSIQDCRCFLYGLKVWMQLNDDGDAVDLHVLSSADDQSQQSIFKIEDIPTHDGVFHHVAIYETSYPTISKVYLDTVDQTLVRESFFTRNAPFNFSNQWRVAAGDGDTTNRFNGCLDELYFTFENFDIGVAANLEKLIDSANLYPRYLGGQGQKPTGSQATIYLKDDCADFYVNYGNLPMPFAPYGELPCCDELPELQPADCCYLIFEDPNKPCGWVIRDPQVECPAEGSLVSQEATLTGTGTVV